MNALCLRENDNFLAYLKSRDDEIIYPDNPLSAQIIKEIIDSKIEKGEQNIEAIINEIVCINTNIFYDIALKGLDEGVWTFDIGDTFDDEILNIADDISEWYFGQDELCILENMLFELVKKYQINLYLSRESLFEYPTFIRRFSNDNSLLEQCISDKALLVQCYNAQQIMFPDLYETVGSYLYGGKNILMMDAENYSSNNNRMLGE